MLHRNDSISFLAILLGALLCLELFGTDVPNGKPVAPTAAPTAIHAPH